jgi:hypothetical protein
LLTKPRYLVAERAFSTVNSEQKRHPQRQPVASEARGKFSCAAATFASQLTDSAQQRLAKPAFPQDNV